MNPKLPKTDPKVQDAYNKVMSGPSVPPPTGSAPQQPQPTTPYVPQPAAPAPPVSPQTVPQTMPANPSVAQQPATTPVAPTPMGSTIAFNANNAGKNQGTTVKRGGSKVMSLALGIGIIVLLIAYTFVWIYVFKLQIPFLPQF